MTTLDRIKKDVQQPFIEESPKSHPLIYSKSDFHFFVVSFIADFKELVLHIVEEKNSTSSLIPRS